MNYRTPQKTHCLLPKSVAATIISLLLACVFTGCFLREWSDPDWLKYYYEGRTAYSQQSYQKAQELFAEALIHYPIGGQYNALDDILAMLNEAQGYYNEAYTYYNNAINSDRDRYVKQSLCESVTKLLVNMGDFDKAKNYLDRTEAIVDETSRIPHHERFKEMSFYQCEAYFLMSQGNYEEAISLYRKALDAKVQSPTITQNIDYARNDLGIAYYYAEDYDMAEKCFTNTLDSNEQAVIPYEVNESESFSHLGRIMERRGKTEEALRFFQRGYEVMRSSSRSGYGRVENSNALCQLGGFYVRQANWVAADKVLREATRLRFETASEHHPDHADVYREMAKVSVANDALTSATVYSQKGISILDAALMPYHARKASHLIAQLSIDQMNNKGTSETISLLLGNILQKPLGPWKEDFLDTTDFYATRLGKEGKTAEAEHLVQLYRQQKDKR